MKDLSIVIVTWNVRDLLAQCLASVYAYPPAGEFEVFVVDNASSDGSAEMVQECFPQVDLIRSPRNAGFARANNVGLRASSGRYVLLLNPDTEILPGAVQTLLDFAEEHPEAGAAGPMILNPDLTIQSSCNPMPTLWREFWRLMCLDRFLAQSIYHEEKWDTGVAHPVKVIQGNCLLVGREALSDVGLLDETYFMFTEEVDFCYRLLQRGWGIYWVPMARIIHYGGQSTRQVPGKMFIELYRSKVAFFRKTRGKWGSVVYKLLLFVTALTRLPWGIGRTGKGEQAAQRRQSYLDLLRVLPYL
jgi:N-acetylglucosaminyl-diphospho-decaprenol L-rhamnosyltransferase